MSLFILDYIMLTIAFRGFWNINFKDKLTLSFRKLRSLGIRLHKDISKLVKIKTSTHIYPLNAPVV